MAASPTLSPLEALRQQRHARWLAAFTSSLIEVFSAHAQPGGEPFEVFLFGSRARGDWDGYSDIDLLVIADEQGAADLWADRLLEAGAGSDVLPVSRGCWQAWLASPSPHWRAVRSQAIPLLPWPP
ncbi:nucleotidyltransferase domain-containing protein [Synechococcus sp. CS-1324]|uniref:nucleotidyltransferase domain-containing protein n=1 Tax=Synechococcus sp. CS-1324 TaxID=2847980 RepID=UPI000DB26EBB|nr:nucleotidyltransferase domain-containing protein [Synechococcus sp. CS-1324]MCT0229488.1 nucleotidyltransferase domain-containing protein [Synechococcus sp. CS-1324]PZV04871.1 MAG: nucleotidyltransferase domain-containing protein [Cyanobium sp.]